MSYRAISLWIFITVVLAASTAWAQTVTVGVIGSSDLGLHEEINRLIAAASGLEIEIIRYSGADGIPAQMAVHMASGSGPDVLVIGVQRARELAELGATLSLDEFIAREPKLAGRMQAVLPGLRQLAEWDGKLIGVPRDAQFTTILYNREHTDLLGVEVHLDWDWAEFETVARRLSVRSASLGNVPLRVDSRGEPMLLQPEGLVLCPVPECWIPFVWANGGDLLDRANRRSALHEPAAREALEFLGGLVQGRVATFSAFGALSDLQTGLASMFPGPVQSLNLPPPTIGIEGSVRLEAVPFPRAPRTGEGSAIVSGSLYVINRNARNVQGTVEFVTHSLSPQVQAIIAAASLYPVVDDAQPIPGSSTLPADLLVRIAPVARSFPPPSVGGTWLWGGVMPHFQAYMEGRVDLDAMLQAVDSELSALYRLAQE